MSNENIPHHSYGYFMDQPNNTKVLIYYDTHKHLVKNPPKGKPHIYLNTDT